MRETLICIGRIARNPYVFPETGAEVYSYEELCYYMSRHLICYLYDLPDPSLLLFIRDELGLRRLHYALDKFRNPRTDQMKYFSTLLREGNYFTEEQLRDILDSYRRLKNQKPAKQCKQLGDMFLSCGRASMAAACYELGMSQEQNDPETLGGLFHNLGVSRVKLFRFRDAGLCFIKAYENNNSEESLYHYFAVLAMTEGFARAREQMGAFQASDRMLEAFESRYSSMDEAFRDSPEFKQLDRIRFVARQDRKAQARRMSGALVRKLQNEFRSELDLDEEMILRKLPF